MKKRIAWILILSLLLSGCGNWMDGEYHSVTPHTNPDDRGAEDLSSVSNYSDICNVLENMVRTAAEGRIVSVNTHTSNRLAVNLNQAIRYIKSTFPLGAYAVEDITYEIGTRRGVSAVSITITYTHNKSILPKIRHVSDMATAKLLIDSALSSCDNSLVLYVEDYRAADLRQLVSDYALNHPDQVMEVPQITETHYPETGSNRVVEIQFTYQSPRDSLLNMQAYVQPVFSSASLYVSGESEQNTKFDMLYTFLMQRNTYRQERSITPAYSLLRHGVGDSKAFASVYAAMCRQANLDCRVIFGTRDGEPWYWNIINQDGNYYHLDLLHSYAMDAFQLRADSQMDGYVWDYSAYPACTTEPESEVADYTDPEDPTGETTEPTEPPTEPSEPTDPTDPTEESTVPTEPPAESPTENESDGTP
jgi:hypothetical protein